MRRRLRAAPGAHLILVGLPGVGKSTVGAALSYALRWEFLDFDAEISRRLGQSIPGIFGTRGEAFFRERELELTRELVGLRPMVLSPGGGWITVPGAAELLRPPACMVYLRASAQFAATRIERSPRERPLLADVPVEATMVRLLAERAPLYEQSDFVVDVEALDVQGVTDRIVELARSGPSPIG